MLSFLPKDTYETFYDEWIDNHDLSSYSEGYGDMRAYLEDGMFVIGVLPEYWDKVNNKQEAVDMFGSEENAKKELKVMVARGHIIHELSHLYQNSDLPLWFMECGAYWYSRDVSKRNDLNTATASNYDKPVDFFDGLISKYGDDIHKLYFSNEIDKEVQDRIFDEITTETIKEIFPNYEI